MDVLELLLKVDVQVFELSGLDVEDPAVNDGEALLLVAQLHGGGLDDAQASVMDV